MALIRKLVLLGLILFMLLKLSAQVTEKEKEYAYQWLSLGMSENPATIQRIHWRTDTANLKAVLQYRTDIPGPDLETGAETVLPVSVKHNDYGVEKIYHTASLQNLKPNTKYIYRIGDGKGFWSCWFQFKTAQNENKAFSFVFIADVQSGISTHFPRIIRQSQLLASDASFYFFTGDLSEKTQDAEISDFFQSAGWISAMKPFAAIPDNHEYHYDLTTKKRDTLSTLWNHIFSYPQNTPADLAKFGNYYFDFQGVRFIGLNSKELSDGTEAYRTSLLGWLEDKLKNNSCYWTIVAHHQPMFSAADNREGKSMVKYLKPLFDKYNVDLSIAGHDHVYTRTSGIKKGQTGLLKGPAYVVSVAGEGMYALSYKNTADRIGSNIQFFQKISISGDTLNFKTYNATGLLYDEFEIQKKNKNKMILDKTPDLPESLELPEARRKKYTEAEWKDLIDRKEKFIKTRNTK